MFLWWLGVRGCHAVDSVRLDELAQTLQRPLSVILGLAPVLSVQLDGGETVDWGQPLHLVHCGVDLSYQIVRELLSQLLPN